MMAMWTWPRYFHQQMTAKKNLKGFPTEQFATWTADTVNITRQHRANKVLGLRHNFTSQVSSQVSFSIGLFPYLFWWWSIGVCCSRNKPVCRPKSNSGKEAKPLWKGSRSDFLLPWAFTSFLTLVTIGQVSGSLLFLHFPPSWEVILRYLHFNKNDTMPARNDADFDKLYKVRPMINLMKQRLKNQYKPHSMQAVDEATIAFKGRIPSTEAHQTRHKGLGESWLYLRIHVWLQYLWRKWWGQTYERSWQESCVDAMQGNLQQKLLHILW